MLHHKTITKLEKEFNDNHQYKLVESILNNTNIDSISENKEITINNDDVFNHELTTIPISHQQQTGNCWLYSCLNVIRRKVIERYELDNSFNLSVYYLFYYDKLEKCNTILEILYQKPRTLSEYELFDLSNLYLLDGGNWDSFKHLIMKYGIIPSSIYTGTPNTTDTFRLNHLLKKIVKDAYYFLNKNKLTRVEFEKYKNIVIKKVHRVMRILCGEPPKTFYVDDKLYTPLSFYNRIVKRAINIEKFMYITSIEKYPYYKNLNKEYSQVVIDKNNNITELFESKINVPMDIFKKSIISSIKRNLSVPVSTYYDRNNSYIFDINGTIIKDILDIDFNVHDRSRIFLNHSMSLVGYHKEHDNTISKYKIENSHGSAGPFNGHVIVTDNWFDKYIIDAIVHKDCIPKIDTKQLDQIIIKFWQ